MFIYFMVWGCIRSNGMNTLKESEGRMCKSQGIQMTKQLELELKLESLIEY